MQVFQSEVAVLCVKKCETSIVVGDKTFNLTENDDKVDAQEIDERTSNQEKTNKRVILYLKYDAQRGFKSALVNTHNKEIFFILLHHAASVSIEIFLDTGSGMHLK